MSCYFSANQQAGFEEAAVSNCFSPWFVISNASSFNFTVYQFGLWG